jgi:hypothetical protein
MVVPFPKAATTGMTASWLARREQPKASNTALWVVTIACDPSLVLNALGCSVPIKPKLMEYKFLVFFCGSPRISRRLSAFLVADNISIGTV